MPLKVIGSRFGRTGTNSLKLALEHLGFAPCHHMFEVATDPDQLPYWQAAARGEMPDWDRVFARYAASCDWPSARFWRQLADHFPDAKLVHTVRDPEKWFKSTQATIYATMAGWRARPPGSRRDRGEMAYELIVNQTFGGRMADHDHAIAVYHAHTEAVRRAIAAERLLVFDIAEGWAPLCSFLGVAVPDASFPRTNSTEEFNARVVMQ